MDVRLITATNRDLEAVRALCKHSWPGNVRDLNQLLALGVVRRTGKGPNSRYARL